ncbi:Cyclin N domain containing protein [Trichuris trichiura]|uniref:Cyclin N domain containing protein n=1 Tax=Trichuris trichiura TaxID=36087 RepID=A0A077Z653_TRITR|nr:Cyclin N domain containing protein [Trichuris trichiura]
MREYAWLCELCVKMTESEEGASKFNLPQLYRRIELSLENAILPLERLSRPPSVEDGLDLETERNLRFLGCQLIQTAAILLRVPQVAAAAGQVLYQRFYYSKSFVRCNFEHTAMACIYLASKIEETPRRIRDVVNVFHHMKQLHRVDQSHKDHKRFSPMPLDHRYVTLKNEVIKAERRVLKELGFCVHIKHPHKLIYVYLKALDALENTALLQKAWNYMNDSLRTDVFMRYSPETIACACVFLGARSLKIGLPMKPPWWQLFDANDDNVLAICDILLGMYSSKPVSTIAISSRLKARSVHCFAVTAQNTPDDQIEVEEEDKDDYLDEDKLANGHSGKRTSGGELSPVQTRPNKLHESNSPVSEFHEKQTSSEKPKHKRHRRSGGRSHGRSYKHSNRDEQSNRHKREEEVRNILEDKYGRHQKSRQKIFHSDINHRSSQAHMGSMSRSSDAHR